jgi:hypothetical protein
MINFELTELLTVCIQATDAHNKKTKFRLNPLNTFPTLVYLATLISGSALMNMIVCLSQAPQNGWETWFSLYFGT